MRTIKFRAWDKVSGRMCPPLTIEYIAGCMPRLDWTNVIPMQFTGLKDKNGKEIYEGDILNTWDLSRVIWDIEKACFGLTNHHASLLPMDHYKDILVIDNIFENSDLLKELNEKRHNS